MLRTAKDIKLKLKNKNFKIRYGTFQKSNPIVIYIIGNVWIEPKYKSDDYISLFKTFNKDFNDEIKKYLYNNNIFDNKTIINIDLCSNRLGYDKKSYLTFEIHLKQKKLYYITDDIIVNEINKLSNYIIQILHNILGENFEFYLKK
jgi:hypothetical protein